MSDLITFVVRSKEEREAAYASEPRKHLTFDFPSDPSVLDFDNAVATFREVLGRTSVKPYIIEGMLPLWLTAHMRGDNRLEVAALGPLLSEGVSFQWPEFTKWRDFFIREKLTPNGWHIPWEVMRDRRLGLRVERITILVRTIGSILHNKGVAEGHSGCPVRGEFEIYADCPASQLVAEQRLASLVGGDARTYPPYFPGDQSTVVRKRRPSAPPV